MVQQPYVGVSPGQMMSTNQQQQQQQLTATTNLAMPAIVGTNQQHQVQAQYSPKANFYQQQLMKGAQQFAGIQQPQQQQVSRMNGIAPVPNQQQDSPISSNHQMGQQQQENLYNGLQQSNGTVRPTPIYAPRPTYYNNQQPAATLTSPNSGQQVYQQAPRVNIQQQPATTAAYHQQQQQNSPSINQQQLLSVRQLSSATTTNGYNAPSSLSPLQNPIEQQQRHLQHLVMSYQQQQQQPYMQQPTTIEPQQHHHHLIQPVNFNESRQWSANNLHVPTNQMQHQQQLSVQQQQNDIQSTLHNNNNNGVSLTRPALSQQQQQHHHQSSARFSDRDSISTVSRFNQFDDRRSFTMRSQYTNANTNGTRKQFGFLELTGEAMKRILGLNSSAGQSQQPLLGVDSNETSSQTQLRRNISLANVAAGKQTASDQLTLDANQQQHKQWSNSVTVIDSGEDYYFKRRVFSYQLVILRLVNLLFSCFVLLSPVVMLLLPKMEPLIRMSLEQQQQQLQSDQLVQSGPLSVSVTHAVGLANKNPQQLLKQQHHHQLAMQQQQQWRISECQSSDCDGPLIGFVIRLILLSIAHWAIFFRSQTATLPRIDFQRCFLISLAGLISLAYWLFFVFRVFDKRYNDHELHYITIINFAISMLETLILLHYLALVLLELRQKKKVYCLKVVRSPDGQSQYLSCGSLSIQKCAQFVLEKYHRNFRQFNAYNEQLLEFEDELAQQLANKRNHQHQTAASSARHQSRANSPTTNTANSHHHHRSRSTNRHRQAQQQPQQLAAPRSTSGKQQHFDEQQQKSRSPSGRRAANKSGDKSEGDQQPTSLSNGNSANEVRQTTRLEAKRSAKRLRSEENNDTSGEEDADEEDPMNSDADDDRSDQQQQHKSNANKWQANGANKDQPDVNGGGGGGDNSSSNSDATSRMKESSLETVRPANEQNGTGQANSAAKFDIKIQEQTVEHSRRRREFETESVRSGRSRRSTASHRRHRSRTDKQKDRERDRETNGHHRHHSTSREHRRERSSSRNVNHRNNEHEDEDQEELAGRDGRATNSAAAAAANDFELVANDRSSGQDLLADHERKLRRRKLRLLATVESAFDQIEQIDINEAFPKDQTITVDGRQQANVNLDAHQAARTVYPTIARSLQKYLRLTKQTGRHNLQSIYEHLSKCLLYKLNARAFLEKFVNLDPVWQQSETNLFANCRLMNSKQFSACKQAQELDINSWSLVCDTLLSRQIESGTFFLLKQGSVSLLVTVAKLPHLNLSEQVIDESLCRFTINPNPETTPV